MENTSEVIQELVNNLYEAFNFFNYELFNNMLPNCAIIIEEKRGYEGLYQPEKFVPIDIEQDVEDDGPKIDKIGLNPTCFSFGEKYVLSTLVHEMAHQWEQEHGTPGKNGNHNREWGETMKSIGLHPSSTGEPGGKETGRKITHYIIDGGLFDKVADKFIEDFQFNINWMTIEKPRKKSTPRKVTYRCECPNPVYTNLSGRKLQCLVCEQELIEDQI